MQLYLYISIQQLNIKWECIDLYLFYFSNVCERITSKNGVLLTSTHFAAYR